MDHLVMKAWRDFGLADPDDCDKEWAAYLALVNKKETASVSSPKNSTSPLHHRVSAAAETAPSTTRSTAPLCVPSGATSMSTTSPAGSAPCDEAKSLYEMLKAETTEEYESMFMVHKEKILDAVRVSVTDAEKQFKDVHTNLNSRTRGASTTRSAATSVCTATSARVPSAAPLDSTPTTDPAATATNETADLIPVTPSTCSMLGLDDSTGKDGPMGMTLTPWSAPPSSNAPPDDLPRLLSAPIGMLELFMLSPSTCSTECPGGHVGALATACPTTHATPPCLLPVTSSTAVPEVQRHDMISATGAKLEIREAPISMEEMFQSAPPPAEVSYTSPIVEEIMGSGTISDVSVTHTMELTLVSLATCLMECSIGIVISTKSNHSDTAQSIINVDSVDLAIVTVPPNMTLMAASTVVALLGAGPVTDFTSENDSSDSLEPDLYLLIKLVTWSPQFKWPPMPHNGPFLIASIIQQQFLEIYSVNAVVSRLLTCVVRWNEAMHWPSFQSYTGKTIWLLWDPGKSLQGGSIHHQLSCSIILIWLCTPPKFSILISSELHWQYSSCRQTLPESFPWYIAWLLVGSSCADSDICAGNSCHCLPAARPPATCKIGALLLTLGWQDVQSCGVLIAQPFCAIVQVVTLCPNEGSFGNFAIPMVDCTMVNKYTPCCVSMEISSYFKGNPCLCGFELIPWKFAWILILESSTVNNGSCANYSVDLTFTYTSYACLREFHQGSSRDKKGCMFFTKVTTAVHIITYQLLLLVKMHGLNGRLTLCASLELSAGKLMPNMEEPWKCVIFLQPKHPWSYLDPPISVGVDKSLHIICVSFEFNQFGLSASHGSRTYVCLNFERQNMEHQFIWLLGVYSSCDRFVTKDGVNFGSQIFEWQIPWYSCHRHTLSSSSSLRMHPTSGQYRCKCDNDQAHLWYVQSYTTVWGDWEIFCSCKAIDEQSSVPSMGPISSCCLHCTLMSWEIASSNDGILPYTTQVLISWDPGGLTPVLAAATDSNWNSTQLQFLSLTWDPGGCTQHRLEGKPNFKRGGLSATSLDSLLGWLGGPPSWAWPARKMVEERNMKHICPAEQPEEIGLERKGNGGFGRVWLGVRCVCCVPVPLPPPRTLASFHPMLL